MKIMLLSIISLALVSATAQELTDRQKAEMVDCALHGGGGWVESSLYANGKIEFSYTLQPSEVKGSQDLYAAFWDRTRTEGRLLVFNLSKTPQHKDYFIINNQGWIWNNQGQPDIRDALWGMYTYRKIKGLLPKLKKRPLIALDVNELRTDSAVCETPLDFKRAQNR